VSKPTPNELFHVLWGANAYEGEESIRPGTPEWFTARKRLHVYWAQVWHQCVELSEFIAASEELRENLKQLTKSEPVEVE